MGVEKRMADRCNTIRLYSFQTDVVYQVLKMCIRDRFQVLRHHLIPPNDGGIGLGQAVYGMAYLNKKKQTDSKNVK